MSGSSDTTTAFYLPLGKTFNIADSDLGLKISSVRNVIASDLESLMVLKENISIDEEGLVVQAPIETPLLILKAIDSSIETLSKTSLQQLKQMTPYFRYVSDENKLLVGVEGLVSTILKSDVVCDKTLTSSQSVGAPFIVNSYYGTGTFTTSSYSGSGTYQLKLKHVLKGSLQYFIIKLVNFQGTFTINFSNTLDIPCIVNWSGNISSTDFASTNLTTFSFSSSTARTGLMEVKAWIDSPY
jgi:hypothetical protein